MKRKIETREANIVVVGLGYVGLPLAVEKGNVGFHVTGIEKCEERVELVNAGKSYIPDVDGEELQELVERGKLWATSSFSCLDSADIMIICVPTPLTATREPDISQIVTVTRQITGHLRKGQLLTLESTTYPGTTQEIILPLLESKGLRIGEDFFLAYSPERIDPGNKRFKTKNISKIVGGVTSSCLELACYFYSQAISQVVPVSSPAAAEMIKVFENTYRAVNIALVNELMFICDRMGLDVWEIVEAASTKPFGFQTFYPGPGVGGHCIPVDPYYLTWKAREYDFYSNLIDLAVQINIKASYYVAEKVRQALNRNKKSIRDARVLVLGAAYKKDINDSRESPAIKIMSLLAGEGVKVSYHDPYIPTVSLTPANVLNSVPLTEKEIARSDCVVIATDHSCFDYEMILNHAVVLVDARNATGRFLEGKTKVIKI
ncbi:MAG: UDP-N-acetyl-D-glucosamine 6-dehydrogenase [Firmicutes bacterium ADurb.Bin456]|nr:MAG: UDP-N-acetyl-D-glucosamine 6-dehydrogenase [Firmicutes bacterium ADurb.Bin456]